MIAPATRTRRIFVVDDDPVVRNLLEVSLRQAGHEVVTASHGGEAVTMLRAGLKVDLILLDLMMPVMDGLRFLNWMREEGASSSMALVFSGLDGKTMSQRALEAGATGYMSKPMQIDDLLARVEELLVA